MCLLRNCNTLTLNYYLTTNFTTTIPKLDFYFSDGNCVYMQLQILPYTHPAIHCYKYIQLPILFFLVFKFIT